MKTPCIILSNVVCMADFHRSCPRKIYAYWREIWLERVPEPSGPIASSLPAASLATGSSQRVGRFDPSPALAGFLQSHPAAYFR